MGIKSIIGAMCTCLLVGFSTAAFSDQINGELLSNFTILDRSGRTFGGTNDVAIIWDEVSFNSSAVGSNQIPTDKSFGLMTISSPTKFFNFNWAAHHIRLFQGPGTFNFDVTCRAADYDAGTVDCNRPLSEQGARQRFMSMTLEEGEIGGHILFNWGKDDSTTECGKANCNIDIVNVWQVDAQWDNHGDAAPKNQLWIGPAGVPPDPSTDWRLVSSDVNGDGINGSPMIDGAFEGSYANFNYLGMPGGRVNIQLAAGNIFECTEHGGSVVTAAAHITISDTNDIVSINWSLDGDFIGSGETISVFTPLDGHTLSVAVDTVANGTLDDATPIIVSDNTPPELNIQYIDLVSGAEITSVSSKGRKDVSINYNVTDICDPAPTASGVASAVHQANDGDTIIIKQQLVTSGVNVFATAVDASGNEKHGESLLLIVD